MQLFPYRYLRTRLPRGCALVLLLLALVSPGAAASGQRLLVLGDSISAAYGMSLEQGWVALLDAALNAGGEGPVVINASISGETTQGGLRRLPGLLQEHQPDLVVIELGGNDGLRGYPIAQLRDNLSKMVQLTRASGARVILVPMQIPPNYGARYTSGFNDSFSSVAAREGATLAPFILDGVAVDPAKMQPDGIHPTVAAQETLLGNMLPTIRAELNRQ